MEAEHHNAQQAMSNIQRANLEWLARELERYRKTAETPLREAVLNGTIDRAEWYRLFELAVAFETGFVMWENLPPCAFENKNLGYFRRLTAQGKKPPDRGIDCASLDLDRVVQAKWYSGTSQVPWRDMSTFHSLATVCAASERTVVSRPGVKLHSLARGLDLTQTELSDSRFLEICAMCSQASQPDLDAFLDELLGEPAMVPPPAALPPLRHCQEQAIELALQSFEDHGTIAVSMPCGTGKSRVIAELVRVDASESPHLVLVPSKLLMYQMEESFGLWAPELKVGLVGDGHAHSPGADVYVCIYNSVGTLTSLEWGMIVVDEAHHVFEEFLSDFSDYPELDASRAYAETIRSLSYEKTLLMSATIPDGDSFPLAYSYTIGEAVADGILCDYQIIIPVFGDGSPRDGIVRLLESHLEWGRVLAYCNSLDAASQFSAQLNACGITADWFGGDTSIKERLRRISALRNGELRVLVTVHTLGEGVDIPEADCCVFVEPRGSPVDVTQCVGRVLRQSPGKTIASVVLPSSNEERDLVRFLSLLGSTDHRIRCGEGGQARIAIVVDQPEVLDEDAELLYESTYSRTGALVAGGEWMVKYELLKQYVEKFGKTPVATEEFGGVKLGAWCHVQRQHHRKNILDYGKIALLESIDRWEWYPYENAWSSYYGVLKRFISEVDRLPKQKETYLGYNIGMWCNNNRSKYTRGILSEDRVAALESLPAWEWHLKKSKWDSNIKLLREYYAENNGKPENSAKFLKTTLGKWCRTQRNKYQTNNLSDYEIQSLNSVEGWIWVVHDNEWFSDYEILKSRFSEEEAPTELEIASDEKVKKLAAKYKSRYRKGKLTQDQVNALEYLPKWRWNFDPDEQWNENFYLLVMFIDEYGSLPPQGAKYRGKNIGNWCSTSRQLFKKGSLSKERVDLLESLPLWRWEKGDVWMDGFNHLCSFITEFGRLPSQKEIYNGKKIGLWCSNARMFHKNGNLSPNRVELLQSIDGWWWVKDLQAQWMENYEAVREFMECYGLTPTPTTEYLGLKIGRWCVNQRNNYKKGSLSEERTHLMDNIPGWWWSKK